MKAIILLALIVATSAAPTSISDNNVGDMINVHVNADVDLTNQISMGSISADLVYRNLQSIIFGLGGIDRPGSTPPPWPTKEISPEMIAAFIKQLE